MKKKMTSLACLLRNIPKERIALLRGDEEVLYSDLLRWVEDNEKEIKEIINSNVALAVRDQVELVKLLCLLDGRVGRILLVPQEVNANMIGKFYAEAEINYEVSLVYGELKIVDIKKPSQNELSNTAWILSTSGTTGLPKLVCHSLESLTRTTKIDIEAASQFRWGLVYDISRFSGIQVFLQSILSGSTLIVPSVGLQIQSQIDYFIANKCNAISATPTFWRKLLMCQRLDNLQLKIVSMGGEIADTGLLKALSAKFTLAKIIHIYASTEAGVGFSVGDLRAGFPKSFLDNGANGIDFKISRIGTLMLKDGKRNKEYLNGGGLYSDSGYIDTGDVIKIEGDRVYFVGRNSGAINVGGNKVQPEEIESVILKSEYVSAARVYAKKSSMMGSIICVDVVVTKKEVDLIFLKKNITMLCVDNLEKYKVPSIIKFVNELDVNENGKIKRL